MGKLSGVFEQIVAPISAELRSCSQGFASRKGPRLKNRSRTALQRPQVGKLVSANAPVIPHTLALGSQWKSCDRWGFLQRACLLAVVVLQQHELLRQNDVDDRTRHASDAYWPLDAAPRALVLRVLLSLPAAERNCARRALAEGVSLERRCSMSPLTRLRTAAPEFILGTLRLEAVPDSAELLVISFLPVCFPELEKVC